MKCCFHDVEKGRVGNGPPLLRWVRWRERGRPREPGRLMTILCEGENIWQLARADRMAIIVDADDYFRLAREALLKAEKRIMLVG